MLPCIVGGSARLHSITAGCHYRLLHAGLGQLEQLHISQGTSPPHVPGEGMPTPTSVVMAPILAQQFCNSKFANFTSE